MEAESDAGACSFKRPKLEADDEEAVKNECIRVSHRKPSKMEESQQLPISSLTPQQQQVLDLVRGGKVKKPLESSVYKRC